MNDTQYLKALLLAAACTGLPATVHATQVVEVTLRDFKIDMPHRLSAGPTTFRITNAGLADHNLEIHGQGTDARLPQDLSSGQRGTFQVNLRPGAYAVSCPVPGHAEAGMHEDLTVEK